MMSFFHNSIHMKCNVPVHVPSTHWEPP